MQTRKRAPFAAVWTLPKYFDFLVRWSPVSLQPKA
jgi:hypothetical protein